MYVACRGKKIWIIITERLKYIAPIWNTIYIFRSPLDSFWCWAILWSWFIQIIWSRKFEGISCYWQQVVIKKFFVGYKEERATCNFLGRDWWRLKISFSRSLRTLRAEFESSAVLTRQGLGRTHRKRIHLPEAGWMSGRRSQEVRYLESQSWTHAGPGLNICSYSQSRRRRELRKFGATTR